MSAAVEILAVRPLTNAGNFRAFASVRIGEVMIHDFRIVQQPGQRAWVSPPQREYEKDGQKKYAAIVELSDALKREVSRVVLAAGERGGV